MTNRKIEKEIKEVLVSKLQYYSEKVNKSDVVQGKPARKPFQGLFSTILLLFSDFETFPSFNSNQKSISMDNLN